MLFDRLGRREFITLLGGATAAWPLVARAQQAPLPVVGFLYGVSPDTGVAAFRKGLSEVGFVESRQVTIEYRYADNQSDRLPELAADLVRRQVTVIAALGGAAPALAAKAATTTIPIVFGVGRDPIQAGLVDSLSRPSRNITGISYMISELAPKRLALLRELLPHAARFAVLFNPTTTAGTESVFKAVRAATSATAQQIEIFNASTNGEIDAAFASLVQKQFEGVLVFNDPLFNNRRVQLTTLAVRYAMPTIYYDREFTEAGGLMSYGSNIFEQYRQVGIYVGRILRGAKPADLPVMQPTKFELVINLQTAKLIGLNVPQALLAVADEVIE